MPLEPLEWELLLLLGWHAKNLSINPKTEHINLLGNGWIRLLTPEATATAVRLISKLTKLGLAAPEVQNDSFCRLSIDPKHLFLSRDLYSYVLPDGDSYQCLALTLREVKTHWGSLHGKTLEFDLPRNMVRVVRTLANGKNIEHAGGIKSDNLPRLVLSAFQGIQSIGLRKFIYMNKPSFHLAVVSSEIVNR